MEKFKGVLDLQSKHRSALGYGLVTLLTAGSEKIFSVVVFQCPCSATWNLPYGLVFLLVPALALFVLGCALSARTWRLLTACCSGSRNSSSWSHSAFVVRANHRGRLCPGRHLGGGGAARGLLLPVCCQREHIHGQAPVRGSKRQLRRQPTAGSLQQAGDGDAGLPESAQGSVSGQTPGGRNGEAQRGQEEISGFSLDQRQ